MLETKLSSVTANSTTTKLLYLCVTLASSAFVYCSYSKRFHIKCHINQCIAMSHEDTTNSVYSKHDRL